MSTLLKIKVARIHFKEGEKRLTVKDETNSEIQGAILPSRWAGACHFRHIYASQEGVGLVQGVVLTHGYSGSLQ